MNKKGIVVLLIILLVVFGYKFMFQNKVSKGELIPAEDATVALANALQNGKPIFLEFTSDNCPACRNAAPWIEEMYQTYKGEVNFILADVNKGGQSLAGQFGVRGVPSFVYFDKEGDVVDAFSGYPAKDGKQYLEEKIKVLLERKGPQR